MGKEILTPMISNEDAREMRVRDLAYAIWEEEGRPEGRADDHWHKAVAIVEAEIAVENMRHPDWLQREAEPAKGGAKLDRIISEPAKALPLERQKRASGA